MYETDSHNPCAEYAQCIPKRFVLLSHQASQPLTGKPIGIPITRTTDVIGSMTRPLLQRVSLNKQLSDYVVTISMAGSRFYRHVRVRSCVSEAAACRLAQLTKHVRVKPQRFTDRKLSNATGINASLRSTGLPRGHMSYLTKDETKQLFRILLMIGTPLLSSFRQRWSREHPRGYFRSGSRKVCNRHEVVAVLHPPVPSSEYLVPKWISLHD